ncbi:MAG: RteC domain-containing protein [Psychroflexus halocasei]
MIYQNLIEELEEKLQALETETDDVLTCSEQSMRTTKEYLNKIRKLVILNGFQDEEAECYFFKKIKPHAVSKLIYYVKLFNIESRRPRSSRKSQKEFLQTEIDKLQNYFNENLEFYHYFRRGSTSLDQHFFLRHKANLRLHPDTIHFVTDDKFSTSHDGSVATIMAYDLLIVYLQKQIEELKYKHKIKDNETKKKIPQVSWTRNKVDLIELVYALHTTGSINGGNTSINEIADLFERVFQIDLGDYYRTYLELRSRKTNQLKFLDQLKASLAQRMFEADA